MDEITITNNAFRFEGTIMDEIKIRNNVFRFEGTIMDEITITNNLSLQNFLPPSAYASTYCIMETHAQLRLPAGLQAVKILQVDQLLLFLFFHRLIYRFPQCHRVNCFNLYHL